MRPFASFSPILTRRDIMYIRICFNLYLSQFPFNIPEMKIKEDGEYAHNPFIP